MRATVHSTPLTVSVSQLKAGEDSSEEGSFTTAPPDTSAAGFSFLIYGDNRTDDTTHASVVRAMTLVPSDFLVNTGDLVEDGNVAGQWQTFLEIEKGLLRDRCVFVAIGNHELLDEAGSNFLRYFGPEISPTGASDIRRLYRSVRWQNMRILFLNGMDAFLSGDARDWLKDELARTDKEPGVVWRMIVSHQGSFSSGPHGNNPRFSSGGLNDLFREHKIDVVISGHFPGDGKPKAVAFPDPSEAEQGASVRLLPLFRMGLGGPVGGGCQWMSWIHLEDLVDLFIRAVDGEWRGAVNGSTPEPVTNAEFARKLGKALHRPAILPAPAFGT